MSTYEHKGHEGCVKIIKKSIQFYVSSSKRFGAYKMLIAKFIIVMKKGSAFFFFFFLRKTLLN